MSWTSTNPWTVGDDTKKSSWEKTWNNCDFCYVPPTTVEFFGQSTAPTGWTKKTNWIDNSMLTYTTGSIGAGGSDDPTSWTTAITTQSESAHTHPMPHTHTLPNAGIGIYVGVFSRQQNSNQPSNANTGAGSAHNHSVNQDTFESNYVKVIAATKDSGTWTTVNPVTAVGQATKQPAHWSVLWTNLEYLYLTAATIQFFGQSTAPTGWTKKTDWTDNSMLVYTTGNVSQSGSDDPTSWTTAITTQSESAHTHPMPHTHTFSAGSYYFNGIQEFGQPSNANTSAGTHNHGINQDTFEPLYQKVIAATKDSGDWINVDPVTLGDPTKKNYYDTAWDNIIFNYFAAGTVKPFGQSTAPTGWTKKTDWTNNSMLVYTTGSIGNGGSNDPTSWTTAITTQNESGHTHPMPHTHAMSSVSSGLAYGNYRSNISNQPSNANTGAGSTHNHGINQDTMTLKYRSIIMGTKDA